MYKIIVTKTKQFDGIVGTLELTDDYAEELNTFIYAYFKANGTFPDIKLYYGIALHELNCELVELNLSFPCIQTTLSS